MKFWSAVFAAVFGMLLVRNRFLFVAPIHELGDSGANSIIVDQAKHFSLLVGNYSRLGFSHPGPGFIYVQAAGEWLFHDVLALVPTPWNGQLIALYALNSAMLATVTVIIGRCLRSWLAAGVALFTMVLLIANHPPVINSSWMPFVYVPTFLLLLFASASVTAGRSRDLWAVALGWGLLIHGHAVFLIFATALGGIAVVAALLRHHGRRVRLPRRGQGLLRRVEPSPVPVRTWLVAAGISIAFLVPIGVHTIAHWPGELGKYLSYGASARAGSHAVWPSLVYAYQYWWPVHTGWLSLLGIPFMVAVGYGVYRIREPFARAGLWLCILVSVLLVCYAYAGVDRIDDPYMGYFYWAVPMFLISCLAGWLTARWAPRLPAALPLAAAAMALALVPGFRTVAHDNQPAVPAALETLSHYANGRPIVVEVGGGDIGLDLPGLANWGRRKGIRLCLHDARWAFITTEQFICTPEEIINGVRVTRWSIEATDWPRSRELTRVGHSAFTTDPAGKVG